MVKYKLFKVNQNKDFPEMYEILGLENAYYKPSDICSIFSGAGSVVDVTSSFPQLNDNEKKKILMLFSTYTDVSGKMFDVPTNGIVIEYRPLYTKDGELILLDFDKPMPVFFDGLYEIAKGINPETKTIEMELGRHYKGKLIKNAGFVSSNDFGGIDLCINFDEDQKL